MKRNLAVATAAFAVALLYSVCANARITNPWSVSLELGGGYILRTPHNSLSNGGFVESGLSFSYTFPAGIGTSLSATFLKGFVDIEPNPFGFETKLVAIPVDFVIFYQHRKGKIQPYVGLGFGYTYWLLDRENLSDADSPHRLDFVIQSGIYYRVYNELFVGALLRFRMPNLFTESERASVWGGANASVLWRL